MSKSGVRSFLGVTALTVCLCVSSAALALDNDGESVSSPQFGVESKIRFTDAELSERMIANAKRSVDLSNVFSQKIQQLLKAADGYDVDAYRASDDELNDTMQQLEANYLEYMMLFEVGPPEWRQLPATVKFIDTNKTCMQVTRMFAYKSSAIFYLCFGLPVQSAHYGRLSASLAEANPKFSDKLSDILFYCGAASFWSGDYSSAEQNMKRVLELDPANRYATYYLGDTYLAQKKSNLAIEALLRSREATTNDEQRGSLDRALSFAYALDKQPKMAGKHIELAKKELDTETPKQFKGFAKESLGVVNALAGKYDVAERILSEALSLHQLSPISLGNRLEAGQTALWRSYCREKLGDKIGAAEDRKYALSISDEASHLPLLASMLDPMFGHRETQLPVLDVQDRWAVVVGIGNFADSRVPRLRYPVKDATDVRDFLIDKAGFKADHIKLLLDQQATRSTICRSINEAWLSSKVRPGDLVLLFVSSHGTPTYKDIGVQNSLVTYDTELEHLFSTSLPMQNIVRMIRKSLKRQHVFIVLDTCYSGGLGAPGDEAKTNANVDPELMIISNYQLLVSSSTSKERSWESKRYPNSVFTRQLLDGLAKYPRYDDFRTVFSEVAEKVNSEVLSDFKYRQTPTLGGRWSGRGLIKPVPVKNMLSDEMRNR